MADIDFSDAFSMAQSVACRMEAIVALVKGNPGYIQVSSAALSSLLEPVVDDLFSVVEAMQTMKVKKS